MVLHFPPEIRNLIYSTLLISTNQPVHLNPSGRTNSLAVLGVCKQTHDEAMPIFYRRNDLRLADPTALYQFLRTLSIRRRRQIAHVTLGHWDRLSMHATVAFKLLRQCIRLASLKVFLAQQHGWLGDCAGVGAAYGSNAFRALRGLKEVVLVNEWDGLEPGGEVLEGVKKGLLEPRSVCKRCERGGRPI